MLKLLVYEKDLPKLNENQLIKLKQLTIVSLSYESRVGIFSNLIFRILIHFYTQNLSYDDIKSSIGINDDIELEKFIIESVFNKIFIAKIDQQNKLIFIYKLLVNRDLSPNRLLEINKVLKNVSLNSKQLIHELETSIQNSQSNLTKQQIEEQNFKINYESLFNSFRSNSNINNNPSDADS